MADKQLTCPGCGAAITWTVTRPGRLRLGCACHSMVFDVAKATEGDISALKMTVERELHEAYAETMAMAAAMAPEAGRDQ
ncbi:MAG: hypothetical protein AB7D37_11155 [Desulfovibrio sp.]